jgi:GT2 family glycosyltransferase
VARRFAGVSLLQQRNRGLSAARNAGWRSTNCDLVLFLDADDRLLPNALQSALAQIASNPDAAFVAGHYRYVAEDGAPLASHEPRANSGDVYADLLRGNCIGMHATVLFRRRVIAGSGGYDEALRACEDYDLLLRISRQHPTVRYADAVAEYRQHDSNMSANVSRMLPAALAALKKNAPDRGNSLHVRAYRDGLRGWQDYYCSQYLATVRRKRSLRVSGGTTILRYAPLAMLHMLAAYGARRLSALSRSPLGVLERAGERLTRPHVGDVKLGALDHLVPQRPVAEKSVEAYYIASFLRSIVTQIAEAGTAAIIFDQRFGSMLDSLPGQPALRRVAIDFDTPGSDALLAALPAELHRDSPVDLLVLVHCMSRSYAMDEVMRSFVRVLRPGGQLAMTLPGCALGGAAGAGHYRRFTEYSARHLVEQAGSWSVTKVTSSGNVLAAVAAVNDVAADDLAASELAARDSSFPLVLAVHAGKTLSPARGVEQDTAVPA